MGFDYTLKRHDDKPFVILFTRVSADPVTGVEIRTPVDFTGYTIIGLLLRLKGATAFVTVATTAPVPANGKITVSPVATDVDTEGVYQAELKTVNGITGKIETFPGNGPGNDVKAFILIKITADIDDT